MSVSIDRETGFLPPKRLQLKNQTLILLLKIKQCFTSQIGYNNVQLIQHEIFYLSVSYIPEF